LLLALILALRPIPSHAAVREAIVPQVQIDLLNLVGDAPLFSTYSG
jgi:hypothetical protein